MTPPAIRGSVQYGGGKPRAGRMLHPHMFDNASATR
jgi:hypothetical protein